eukprot:CAMPEP_0177504888 /NCGR_PEP_ID=MMETSP0369-20130122/39104_1 /TAXON_ID=447022 ORGANISM="Scrippsiella hangoei-like, Strain SHHI-4" /NCGR_SAMPLE_ID=MMETSP0369 /ASSEMBLY_ACC=CAM_ASM_000364 /LENGTH=31 /DNA_ID= /DNA_START= /DNA_END= /DNA_ORIENTATION=
MVYEQVLSRILMMHEHDALCDVPSLLKSRDP